MTTDDRTAAILDANKVQLFNDNQVLRETLAAISSMLDRFDTFGDAGRTRAFIGDLRGIVNEAEAAVR